MSGSRNASRRSAAGSGCWRWGRRSRRAIGRRWPPPPLAPDDRAAMPDPAAIQAFRISGPVGIKLHRGTWHAGPFFTQPEMDFLNLELADTNESDHVDCHLGRDHGVRFRFEG